MTVSIGHSAERSRTSGPLNERAILRLGLALAACFMVSAGASLALSPAMAAWSAIHLALAGAATVAIGAFMPHFSVTLAGVRPAHPVTRLVALALLAAGAAAIVVAVPAGAAEVVVLGGSSLLAGLGLTAWVTFAPVRHGLARRHPIVQVTYGMALAQLGVGSLLAMLTVAGWAPAAENWVRLKPAHVWLNLFGFVSLTIVATLIYLYPTVLGARIRMHPTLVVGTLGVMAGPPVTALGMVLSLGTVALLGAGLATAGALGLVGYVAEVWRRRGAWKYDRDWHRLSSWHLSAGVCWFAVALGAMFVEMLRAGATPPGWTLGALAVPVVLGWVLQVLVGSWGHLLPAVGPGTAGAHARQRALLGRWPVVRVAALNVGVVLLWAGLAGDRMPLIIGGAAMVVGVLGLAVTLLAVGLRVSTEPAP